MNILQSIRAGEMATVSVPRATRQKLWDWCRKRSEIDGNRVNVGVIHSMPDYRIHHYEERVRMGRAIPRINIHPQWNFVTKRNEIGTVFISWSYVK